MAYVEQFQAVSLDSGGDLSGSVHRFAVLASDGQLDVVSVAGGDADGVLMGNPKAAGRAVALAYAGVVKVVAGDALDPGMKIASDDQGRAVEAASGDHVLGKALSAVAEPGEMVEVLLESRHVLA